MLLFGLRIDSQGSIGCTLEPMGDEFDKDLVITPQLRLPAWEVVEKFVRASGRGGQHVNKVSTAVQLRWNVANSSLPAPVKVRFARLFANRLSSEGDIVIEASRHRSQLLNRKEARQRLVEMVARAAVPPKTRHTTRPTKGSVRRRLTAKKRRSDVKALRGKVDPSE